MPAKPTEKQAKALELIRQGTKPTIAMREAGYTPKTAEAPSQNLLRSAAAENLIEQYKAEYSRVGITPKYMAAKTAQWLEAKKQIAARTGNSATAESDDFIEVDDFQTQLKAADMVRKDWGLGHDITLNQTNVGEMSVSFIDATNSQIT